MKSYLLRNIGHLLTLSGVAKKDGRRIKEEDLSLQSKAAIAVLGGKLAWVGSDKAIPKSFKRLREINVRGQTVLPAFVECHTHSIFAGTRSQEFELRNQGVSYQEIAAKGGGILSTMHATRQASEGSLLQLAQARADAFVAQGVATLEIKSGYALNAKDEIKCLKVAKKIKGPKIVSTFLGAHALPPEFSSSSDYLESLIEVLRKIKKAKLAERVDIFVEKGFFEKFDSNEYLTRAKQLGFEITIHAEQLSLSGGAELALFHSAVSADHLLQINPQLQKRLAKSNVTCVLLPMADLYMRCNYPPARSLIDQGARVALATDFNPGSCPSQDLSLVGLLARLEMKMSLSEVIAAYTYGGAAALGLQAERGILLPGYRADFISIDEDWTQLFYSAGSRYSIKTYRDGARLN